MNLYSNWLSDHLARKSLPFSTPYFLLFELPGTVIIIKNMEATYQGIEMLHGLSSYDLPESHSLDRMSTPFLLFEVQDSTIIISIPIKAFHQFGGTQCKGSTENFLNSMCIYFEKNVLVSENFDGTQSLLSNKLVNTENQYFLCHCFDG